MHRRAMLKVGGMAALGFGAAACGGGRTRPAAPAPRPALHLAPVHVSWDRVTRTSVGLRPFRRGGFRVEIERFDDTTVVHNYGHGGGGISLSWGTAALAADLALPSGERQVAVVGAGAVGLATARTLQRRGYDVTIYAEAFTPYTTSDHAPAAFTPGSRVIDFARRSSAFDERYVRAATDAYNAWQLLVGERYGVRWMYNYAPTDQEQLVQTGGGGDIGGLNELTPDLRGEQILLGPGEHPFPTRFARRRATLLMETTTFLRATLDDFFAWGGRVVPRRMRTPRDLVALPERLVFACVGLGGRELFGDEEIVAVKGQLVAIVPQPEVDYMLSPGGGLNMVPRRDGIMLGTTGELGVWTMEPDEAATRRIVEGHVEFFAAMRGVAANGELRRARHRPAPEPPPIETPRYTRDWYLDQLADPGL